MSQSNCLICILLRYSIDRHTDLDRFFTINPEDGFIKTTKPLDREETAWLNITVFAAEIRKYSSQGFDSALPSIIASDSIFWEIKQLRQTNVFGFKQIFQSLKCVFGYLSRKTHRQREMFLLFLTELGIDLAREPAAFRSLKLITITKRFPTPSSHQSLPNPEKQSPQVQGLWLLVHLQTTPQT